MRLPAALLAVLMLAPAASAAWTQAGGAPTHDGRANLGDLDVVAQVALLPDGLVPADPDPAGNLVVDTPRGLLSLGRAGAECRLAVLDLRVPDPGAAAAVEASGPIACPQGGRLAGWDGANGRALLCIDGAQLGPLLQSWPLEATEPAWTRAPQADAPDPLSIVPSTGGAAAAGLWSCRVPAIDAAAGRVVVGFSSSEGRNRVEALALTDGAPQWSTAVPSSVFLGTPSQVPQLPELPAGVPAPVEDATGAFAIRSVTLTASGVVVAGRLDGTNAGDAPPGLAWFSPDGALNGAMSLSPGANPDPNTGAQGLTAASRASAASGRLAAHLVGDGLFVVDPANAQGTTTQLGTPSLGQTDLAAPCWSRDTLVVPGESAAFLVPSADPSGLDVWGGFEGGRLQACAVTGSSAWVVVTRSDNGTKTDLVEVGLGIARSVRRIPIPLAPADPLALALNLVPLDGGRLAVHDGADAVLLAPVPGTALPVLLGVERYPGPGTPAKASVARPAGAPDGTRLLLAWGDGLIEEVAEGEHAHTLVSRSDHPLAEPVLRLTAVTPDNQTSTRSVVLHYGATPPAPRNFFEFAFAPENQNYTFTIIGLLITLGGALIAAVGVARGRNRLGRHLAALDRIRDDGRREPFVAIRTLHDFREARRADLGKGKLEDAQFVVLEAAAGEVLQLLRQRILGNYVGRVSDRFSHALDLALADGDIDDAEGAGLLEMAKSEPDLTAGEKARLGGLVESWQRVI